MTKNTTIIILIAIVGIGAIVAAYLYFQAQKKSSSISDLSSLVESVATVVALA